LGPVSITFVSDTIALKILDPCVNTRINDPAAWVSANSELEAAVKVSTPVVIKVPLVTDTETVRIKALVGSAPYSSLTSAQKADPCGTMAYSLELKNDQGTYAAFDHTASDKNFIAFAPNGANVDVTLNPNHATNYAAYVDKTLEMRLKAKLVGYDGSPATEKDIDAKYADFTVKITDCVPTITRNSDPASVAKILIKYGLEGKNGVAS